MTGTGAVKSVQVEVWLTHGWIIEYKKRALTDNLGTFLNSHNVVRSTEYMSEIAALLG